ncbi:MAG: hypothetical protein ACAI25_11620 [Planctomycetota bacterium]
MLEDVRIARPCGADWAAMSGDDRVRFCQLCKLNVYNLSGMRREDAEALVASREGDICVRFYTRKDGTVLTQDCPVGLAAVKRRMALVAASVLGLLSLAAASILGYRAVSDFRRAIAVTPLPDRPRPPRHDDDDVKMGKMMLRTNR